MLKAYLVSHRTAFEKLHDLRRLFDHCAKIDSDFHSLRDSVEPLTLYAVAFRYPGPATPSREEVDAAMKVVVEVWKFVSGRLPPEVVP